VLARAASRDTICSNTLVAAGRVASSQEQA